MPNKFCGEVESRGIPKAQSWLKNCGSAALNKYLNFTFDLPNTGGNITKTTLYINVLLGMEGVCYLIIDESP